MKILDNRKNKTHLDFSSYVSEDFFNGDEFEYHKSLKGYSSIALTQLVSKPESLSNHKIFVKDESRRFHLKAFKALGASYAIHKYLTSNPGKYTFCTATDGNHGRAVAWVSVMNKMKAVVFVPENTDSKIISNIKNEGADVRVVKGYYNETVRTAKSFSDRTGAVLIQDSSFDGYTEVPRFIMQGYLTQLRETKITLTDFVILQAGVGTWAGSVILYYLKYHPNKLPQFVIVEPEEAACCYDSAIEGKPVKARGSFKTVMAGLNCGTPSIDAFEILKDHADYFITISDKYIYSARKVYNLNGIESGMTGASGLAGLLALVENSDLLNSNDEVSILVFNSEGDTY